MNQHFQVTGLQRGKTRFPRYDEAAVGFENYWYPVMRSKDLKDGKPQALTLFGERIMFYRDQGRAFALHDRCPHRGIPLSKGTQVFPKTWSCIYHGWTYDLETGKVVAALTDGPDSKVCGNAHVRVYPVEERAGLIWIYNGKDTPPPVEQDIPSELLRDDAAMMWRFTERPGDWRYGAENGFDDGHGKFLHRNSWFAMFMQLPGWIQSKMVLDEEGWLVRKPTKVDFQGEFPRLGKWPKIHWWKSKRVLSTPSIRLPCMLRVELGKYMHFEWYVPTKAGHHRYAQVLVKHTNAFNRLFLRLRYWTYIRWIFHVSFNNEDAWMVELTETPPEQLYRPDLSIIEWRKMCENARGTKPSEFEVEVRDDFSQRQESHAGSKD
ncbi:Rieske 2Fe-2S domain-containing protein [Bradyrhizobium sp. NP1]|uniref:Rieske 2Fe-2S domain-containing protein n=1 Tax=Bradyrhizobium sp. NP1 TaxID=3049772 RepID=UPI0025A6744B|nr:Rieske 2Fe-2S domain-containing protein [Bradyrhizobium sp. NP1]WJR76882.1 Rieske 2Fe-2S domain-containing protein [Bradyrhizobium sp. NP1]